jgi:beta-lactamase regulating signal transducer with metallopeptidase domain
MTNLAHEISPELLQALGWTLLHFVWQGAALAALFAVAATICRSASARYALAVATLILMIAFPAVTFTRMYHQTSPAVRFGAQGTSSWAGAHAVNAAAAAPSGAPAAGTLLEQPMGMLWLVEAWLLGVILLSLRTAGGLLVIARMRRREIKPVARELYEKCVALQRRMGLDRVIRYCECFRLDAPAVLGWFHPVVLLPARALTGLTEEQIAAVIAHELAHIRRLDCFVNLFQIAAETLLFYHPGVWWVSQRIRAERENCCDDEAISVCGDALNYARALALMEEWRAAPSLLMAANRSPLSQRVLRLLGLDRPVGRIRVAGLAVGFACLAAALLAGNAFLGVAQAALGTVTPAQQEQGSSVIVVTPEPASAKERNRQPAKPTGAAAQTDKNKNQQTAGDDQNKKESYLDAMQAAGFKDLTVDEIISMKIQGITPAYVKEIHALGLQPTADEIIGMRVQEITPEYIREMRAIESNLTVDELIGMKVQGITSQYAHELRELGLKAGADELIGMKVQGITPQYVQEMRQLGLQTGSDDLIGMKVQGVTPEYIRDLRATGLKPDSDELIGMKVQGITAEYVKTLQAAGFKDLTSDEVIGAKVQGITPDFIEKARKHGFQNLTLEKLIELKHADIF